MMKLRVPLTAARVGALAVYTVAVLQLVLVYNVYHFIRKRRFARDAAVKTRSAPTITGAFKQELLIKRKRKEKKKKNEEAAEEEETGIISTYDL